MQKTYTIHIDVDSPVTLSHFYNKPLLNYSTEMLDRFYESAFNRAFDLLEKHHIKATFFCVASEIEHSVKIQQVLRKAIEKGHFIAHHTYTHPFGLNELSTVRFDEEIKKASTVFENQLGVQVLGFRSPGYAIDTNAINGLKDLGLKYDSSAGWPLFHVLFKIIRFFKGGGKASGMKVGYGECNSGFRAKPYSPHRKNWKKTGASNENFLEYPLPSSCYLIPCYSNLHLYFAPALTRFLISQTKRYPILVYLMHIIEFSSSEDDFVPAEIHIHPNVLMPLEKKLKKLNYILSCIGNQRKHISIEGEMIANRKHPLHDNF